MLISLNVVSNLYELRRKANDSFATLCCVLHLARQANLEKPTSMTAKMYDLAKGQGIR